MWFLRAFRTDDDHVSDEEKEMTMLVVPMLVSSQMQQYYNQFDSK